MCLLRYSFTASFWQSLTCCPYSLSIHISRPFPTLFRRTRKRWPWWYQIPAAGSGRAPYNAQRPKIRRRSAGFSVLTIERHTRHCQPYERAVRSTWLCAVRPWRVSTTRQSWRLVIADTVSGRPVTGTLHPDRLVRDPDRPAQPVYQRPRWCLNTDARSNVQPADRPSCSAWQRSAADAGPEPRVYNAAAYPGR